jgi:NADPH:quinone reductase-like Zn-dependent oxidoreductase
MRSPTRVRSTPSWSSPVRVAEVIRFGGPEVLHPGERPDPMPGPGELLVRIHAANINPTDLGARSGQIKRRLPELEPPFVPGWDLAGEVVEGGGGFAAGDRVVGFVPFTRIGGAKGSYAELAAVEPDWLAPLADDIGWVEGATLPLNALTAHEALARLGLPAGARLLVTGASGAVGGFAVQLGAAAGLRVVAQASGGDEDWVAGLGAAEVLPRDADLGAIETVDGVLDAVPLGPDESTGALRDGGKAVFTRGQEPPAVEREIELESFLVSPDGDALRELATRFAAGELRTRVARVLPLEQAAEGHRLVEGGGLRGKVVLTTG